MAEGKSFWSSLPGILTALAGLITAGGGLLLALQGAGLIGGGGHDTATVQAPAEPALLERLGVSAPPRLSLRGVPTTLSEERLTATLIERGLYDARLNPAGAGIDNRFETVVQGDDVVVRDATTGLVWQRGGTSGLDLAGADTALARLNERGYAGYRDWRLPTAEEAASLMKATPVDGRHIDPAFGSGVGFIWTADRTPDGKAYVAYWADGRLSTERPDFHAWLRAVR
jgi:hypothetical protein